MVVNAGRIAAFIEPLFAADRRKGPKLRNITDPMLALRSDGSFSASTSTRSSSQAASLIQRPVEPQAQALVSAVNERSLAAIAANADAEAARLARTQARRTLIIGLLLVLLIAGMLYAVSRALLAAPPAQGTSTPAAPAAEPPDPLATGVEPAGAAPEPTPAPPTPSFAPVHPPK